MLNVYVNFKRKQKYVKNLKKKNQCLFKAVHNKQTKWKFYNIIKIKRKTK